MGPGADTNTEIDQAQTLKDFSQKVVNETAQDLSQVKGRQSDENTLKGLLEQKILDDSAVNIDEELGFLIVVQTAYAASARMVAAIKELFDELLNAV